MRIYPNLDSVTNLLDCCSFTNCDTSFGFVFHLVLYKTGHGSSIKFTFWVGWLNSRSCAVEFWLGMVENWHKMQYFSLPLFHQQTFSYSVMTSLTLKTVFLSCCRISASILNFFYHNNKRKKPLSG